MLIFSGQPLYSNSSAGVSVLDFSIIDVDVSEDDKFPYLVYVKQGEGSPVLNALDTDSQLVVFEVPVQVCYIFFLLQKLEQSSNRFQKSSKI